jgi:hypothetical protein
VPTWCWQATARAGATCFANTGKTVTKATSLRQVECASEQDFALF